MLRRLLTLLSGSSRTGSGDGAPSATDTAPNPGVLSPYAAVTVTTTATCCEAARATQARPILWSAQPKLPLPGCTMADRCVCRFRHWPDRRIGERRNPDDATITTRILQASSRPRSGKDRRKSKP